MSCKSIGSSDLENDCNEGKVMVIRKVIWRTHSLFLMKLGLLSKQWSVGLLQEKLENSDNLNSSDEKECKVMNLEA